MNLSSCLRTIHAWHIIIHKNKGVISIAASFTDILSDHVDCFNPIKCRIRFQFIEQKQHVFEDFNVHQIIVHYENCAVRTFRTLVIFQNYTNIRGRVSWTLAQRLLLLKILSLFGFLFLNYKFIKRVTTLFAVWTCLVTRNRAVFREWIHVKFNVVYTLLVQFVGVYRKIAIWTEFGTFRRLGLILLILLSILIVVALFHLSVLWFWRYAELSFRKAI